MVRGIIDKTGLWLSTMLLAAVADAPPAATRPVPPPTVRDVPLFDSARAAIRFAVTRVGAPAPPAMNAMVPSAPRRPSRGLGGLDGVAQAGMIMQVLRGLGELNKNILIANEAPRFIRCGCKRPCCSKRRVNPEWAEAVAVIAKAAVAGALCKAPYRLREAIVVSIYGQKLHYWEIAREAESTIDVVGKHYRPIYRWLYGSKGGMTGEPVPGVDPVAWRAAEQALIDSGIVGAG